jgi:nitrite reductase (NADH) small subunit
MSFNWFQICPIDVLQPERGVAALIDGLQIAIFQTHDGTLYAIANRDPIAKAQVMSRGIVGTRGSAPTVASPLHKQVYDLRTGECLDLPGIRIPTYPVRCVDGRVEISVT